MVDGGKLFAALHMFQNESKVKVFRMICMGILTEIYWDWTKSLTGSDHYWRRYIFN